MPLKFEFIYEQKVDFLRELSSKYENSIAVICAHENLSKGYKKLFKHNKRLKFYAPVDWRRMTEPSVVFDEYSFFFPGRLHAPLQEIFFEIAARDIPILGIQSLNTGFDYYPKLLKRAFFNRLNYAKYLKAEKVEYVATLRQLLRVTPQSTIFIGEPLSFISAEIVEIILEGRSYFRLGGERVGFFSFLISFYRSVPRFFFDTVIKLKFILEFY